MVEIDAEVVKVSKKYFKKLAPSYEDARVELIHANGAEWVKKEADNEGLLLRAILLHETGSAAHRWNSLRCRVH